MIKWISEKSFLWSIMAYTMVINFLAVTGCNAGDDPFAKATEKANEIQEALTGPLAKGIVGIAIAGGAIGGILKLINKNYAIVIVVCGIILGSVQYFVDWMFT